MRERERGRGPPEIAMKAWMRKKRGRLRIDCLEREGEGEVEVTEVKAHQMRGAMQ